MLARNFDKTGQLILRDTRSDEFYAEIGRDGDSICAALVDGEGGAIIICRDRVGDMERLQGMIDLFQATLYALNHPSEAFRR